MIQKINKWFNKTKYHPVNKKLLKEYNAIRPKKKRKLLCHAPFKSLLFNPSGEVTLCHYNRGLSIGKYPENSIHEIWFGKKINKLRKYIRHNDMSLGCQSCKKDIINKNFYSTGAIKYDYLPDSDSDYPCMLSFQIDNTCTLECIMCSGEYSSSIRKNREKKSAYKNPYDLEFVRQIEEFIPHLKTVSFTGGEPFLIDLYYDIWDRIIKINPDITVYVSSNGTILNNKVKELLNKANFNLTISIDSLQKETYESIRKNSKFENVISNIKYFYDYSKKNNRIFSVKFVLMHKNYQDIPELFKFWNDKSIQIYANPVVIPTYISLQTLEPDKLKKVIDYLSVFSFENNTEIQKNNNRRYKDIINRLTNWHKKSTNRKSYNFFENKNILEIKNIFFKQIKCYVTDDYTLKKEEKKVKINKIITISEKIFDSIQDEKIVKNSLIKFIIGLPVDMIIEEMERTNIEALIARFEQESMDIAE